nr:uncharacterized protein LOC111507259 isoform X2 [Leptinotarsa decemlineata]
MAIEQCKKELQERSTIATKQLELEDTSFGSSGSIPKKVLKNSTVPCLEDSDGERHTLHVDEKKENEGEKMEVTVEGILKKVPTTSDIHNYKLNDNERLRLEKSKLCTENKTFDKKMRALGKHVTYYRSKLLKEKKQRSRRNSGKNVRLQKSLVKMTVQEKHEEIVDCSNSTSISGTTQYEDRDTDISMPKKKLRNAPKIDLNSDDFDPLDLNNLLLSTTTIFQGMCNELKNSMVLNNPDNLGLDNEQITLTTSAGDKEQSVQIVIVNNKPGSTKPSFNNTKDNLEQMLEDIEKTIASAEKDYQENVNIRTISTQTDNRSLEIENKKLKLEIATLKSRIISLQNQLKQQDVPQLLFVCNDE